MAGGLSVEAPKPDRVHLELGRQQISNLPGLLITTFGEVLQTSFPLCEASPASRASSTLVR